MKVDRRNREIRLDIGDDGYLVILEGYHDEVIALKVTYTDKGFGVQVFDEEEYGYEANELLVFNDRDNVIISTYFGIWKFIDKVKRRLKRYGPARRGRR